MYSRNGCGLCDGIETSKQKEGGGGLGGGGTPLLKLRLEPLQHPVSCVRCLARLGQHTGRAIHLTYALQQLVQER